MIVITNMIGGGAQKTVANLSKYFSKYFDLHIVTLYDTKDKYDFEGELHHINYNIPTASPIQNYYLQLKGIWQLKKLKKELNIKCSISFLPEADIMNILSCNGERTIISIRNNLSKATYLRGIFGKLFKYCLAKADRIVAITNGVKDDMVTNFGVNHDKITTVYNPILDLPFSTSVKQTKNYITTMGRLELQKGHNHLIRAFKYVVDEYDSTLKLIILGEGSMRQELSKLIVDLKMEKNVILQGFVSNPLEVISRGRLFIFPSAYEGLGNSLLEVLQLGLPIISSDCNFGPREILSPNTEYDFRVANEIDVSSGAAVLIPAPSADFLNADVPLNNQEKLMAEAIIRVLSDDALGKRLSCLALQRAQDFTLTSIGDIWRDIINEEES